MIATDDYEEYGHRDGRTQRRGFIRRLSDDEVARLPGDPAWLSDHYDIVLVDRATGKEYQARHAMPIERDDFAGFTGIQGYFAYSHYCGCHRISSSLELDTMELTDKETPPDQNYCPPNRFIVKSIMHRNLPGVNLYYEEPVGEYVQATV